ncbi:MAG: hypothetical protein WCK63_14870 [Betaproteobacteria bacterium]
MTTITFDTLEATRRLRDAGFDEKQSETVVRVLSDAQSQLVTREHFDAKFALLQWMLGAVLVLAIANFAKQYF